MKLTCHRDRRAFLRRVLVGALAARAMPGWARAQGAAAGRVQWARLQTSYRFWRQHQDQDALVARLIQEEAHLPMDPHPLVVQATDVGLMSQFPLIFTNNLTALATDNLTANAKEYLRRGGFFYIDGCIRQDVTPDFEAFFRAHADLFQILAPGSELRMLDEAAPIFRSFFKLTEAETRTGRGQRGHWAKLPEGLYGVFQGQRMISLLSLDHLWCGWPQDPERMGACLKEIANIYVFAMTR